jgi:membrane protein implicated in regulation of membrane protease activity
MPDWAVWMIVAGALAIGEMATAGLLVMGMVAVAAVASAVVAAAGGGLVFQLVVFIAASLGTLALLRPIVRRHVHAPPAIRTGTAALPGARAVVVARVDAHGGRVKLIGGEEWSARAFFDDQVIEPGARVEIVRIEGATALVHE